MAGLIGLFEPDRFIARTNGSQVCIAEPEIFFAEDKHGVAEATRACTRCPFFLSCRLEGLEQMEQGVWGGLSYNQRIRMGRAQRQAEIRRLYGLLDERTDQWTGSTRR